MTHGENANSTVGSFRIAQHRKVRRARNRGDKYLNRQLSKGPRTTAVFDCQITILETKETEKWLE